MNVLVPLRQAENNQSHSHDTSQCCCTATLTLVRLREQQKVKFRRTRRSRLLVSPPVNAHPPADRGGLNALIFFSCFAVGPCISARMVLRFVVFMAYQGFNLKNDFKHICLSTISCVDMDMFVYMRLPCRSKNAEKGLCYADKQIFSKLKCSGP